MENFHSKRASLSVFLFNYLKPFALLFELQIRELSVARVSVSATDLQPLLSIRSFRLVAGTTGAM